MNGLPGNLLEQVPHHLQDEQFIELLTAPGLRIERIVSTGHSTPRDEWLEQAQAEWVLLIQGGAAVRLQDAAEACRLRPGDHLHIPAGRRHRVEWTTAEPPAVWLAVHYGSRRDSE